MCKDMKKTNCQCCGFYNRIEVRQFCEYSCIEKSIEEADAERAVRIVQNWSDKNPPKTYLSEFTKAFPHCRIHRADVPFFCLKNLGVPFTDSCNLEYSPNNKKCQDCWNTPINEESEVR